MSVRSFVLGGLAALLLPSAAWAIDLECNGATATRLHVNVTGVRSSSGIVAATLYPNDPKRFLARRGQIGIARAPAKAGTTTVCVAVPPGPGKYALAVYHDVDGDRRLDRTVIGLPSEPFALSNNPPPRMAFPKIGPSLFSVGPGETNVTVRLHKPRKEKTADLDEGDAWAG